MSQYQKVQCKLHGPMNQSNDQPSKLSPIVQYWRVYLGEEPTAVLLDVWPSQ